MRVIFSDKIFYFPDITFDFDRFLSLQDMKLATFWFVAVVLIYNKEYVFSLGFDQNVFLDGTTKVQRLLAQALCIEKSQEKVAMFFD